MRLNRIRGKRISDDEPRATLRGVRCRDGRRLALEARIADSYNVGRRRGRRRKLKAARRQYFVACFAAAVSSEAQTPPTQTHCRCFSQLRGYAELSARRRRLNRLAVADSRQQLGAQSSARAFLVRRKPNTCHCCRSAFDPPQYDAACPPLSIRGSTSSVRRGVAVKTLVRDRCFPTALPACGCRLPAGAQSTIL
jgi:hypothetical protein